MFSRFFGRNPHTGQRAQTLIADFLKQHKQKVSAFALAQHTVANVEAGGVDAALEDLDPNAQVQLGRYPFYAVQFVIFASGLCAPLLPEPMDSERSFAFAGIPLSEGLGIEPRAAAEMIVRILIETPLNEDGSELDEAQIAALPENERRMLALQEIAQEDGNIVLDAFYEGEKSVDLSDYDVAPLAELLELSVESVPER